MKNLFHRLASSRSCTKLRPRPMHAGAEERRRVIGQSSVLAVLALAAFVSLGALLFPEVGQAQDCVWDCDLGSDPSNNPWGNSPQSQLDIAYCIDRDCVVTNFSPLIGSLPSATTDVRQDVVTQTCGDPTKVDVRIFGPVVAMPRDGTGSLIAGSAAQAFLDITIKCVTLSGVGSGSSTLSRVVVPKEPRTNVFAATSNIRILASSSTPSLSSPKGWTGCPTKGDILSGDCAFPLGIVEFNNNNAIENELPAAPPFIQGEVFRAVELTRFVGVRNCKGPADPTPNSVDPSTIECSVGGGQSLALLFLPGNWSGATAHTFNPKSGSNPYDIDISTLPPGISILPNTVLASANGGNPIFADRCNEIPSQNVGRCFFNASALNVVCKTGDPVDLLVTGQLEDGRKFNSTDPLLTCSTK
jgi:hypothetical protein